jgi:type III pantothenate kinase
MNRLLVDIGNSRVKWRVETDAGMRSGAAAHGDAEMAWQAIKAIEEVVATNVAGEVQRAGLEDTAARLWACPVRWITATRNAGGVVNAYAEPARLGADRWAALIAARAREEGPAWVVDCGTALTIDGLAADGRHLGGLIVPGLSLMRGALYAKAPGIPDEGEGGEGLLGGDTRSAVSLGALHCAAGFIEHVVARGREAMDADTQLYLTGGDAARLSGLVSVPHEVVPELVLDGLAVLARTGEAR